MKIPVVHVDAFTSQAFRGNPAAVCPLESWLDDQTLQSIAAENNLSETAFLVGGKGSYEIRWMTPATEVDLCGHATLASAFVLFGEAEKGRDEIVFRSIEGWGYHFIASPSPIVVPPADVLAARMPA